MPPVSTTTAARVPSNRFLNWWGRTVIRFPWLIILLSIVFSGISLQYTLDYLGVNTDTSQMLSQELPFQKNRLRLEKAFPQDSGTIVMVVTGKTPEETSQAAKRLAELLEADTERFKGVRIPDENPFFEQEALLYLELDELENLATELSRAQPFIGRLANDYTLNGFLSILGYAIADADESLPLEIDPLLVKIDEAIDAVLAGRHYRLSWQELMLGEDSMLQKGSRFVIAQPKVDFTEIMPAEASLMVARNLANKIKSKKTGVNVRITGELALEHEELESVSRGAVVSSIASLFLVCLVMWIGLRSLKLVFASLIILLIGLSLTAGFATLAIGHLNLISVAFAVLYIGLGVDFAIHLCLRHGELRMHHHTNRESLISSVETVGTSLFLCTLTTAIGFFAFVPTAYAGVSELGIISGVGMFIGLIVTLTTLPALLSIMPLKAPKPLGRKKLIPEWVFQIPFRYATAIKIVCLLVALGAAFLLSEVTFDSNPVNLRDPKSESVSTFKELLKYKDESPFFLSLLTDDPDSAVAAAGKLEKLNTVNKAITVLDLIPQNQDEKLDIIDNLSFILGGHLSVLAAGTPGGGNPRKALEDFLAKVNKGIEARAGVANNDILIGLRDRLENLLATADTAEDPSALPKSLETSILGLLPAAMKQLRNSLGAVPATLDDIPPELTEHWISKDGTYRVMIFPEEDLNNRQHLREFVEQVQNAEPNVTGLPVADRASGDAVVNAFRQAFTGALAVIGILLLVVMRNIKDTLLVLFPLLLAGALTGAATVLLDSPFNFANIIALPLLMGIGVDSGIHIVHRLRHAVRHGENPLHTSTARGVFFASATTLCSFSSLAFTSHRGTASMGLLLGVGITFTLLCTLVVLPAFSGRKLENL
ncbi:MAG: MMPL family transporter [Pseudomonadota bacterium]